MKKNTLLIILCFSLFYLTTNAQSNRWKRTRYEVVGGIGLTGFMGDLGGGSVDSKYIGDFNFTSQRPLLSAGLRYKILEPLAIKGTLSFGFVQGDDKKSSNIYNLDRNLNFYSSITELAAQFEYSIIKEPVSHRYNLRRGRKFSLRNIKINTYLFAGIAGFYFNPKGRDDGPDGSGDWVKLRPLGTEGQGLMESREMYSRFSVAFPMGIGFKYNVTRRISIGAEFGARYTFTDYIDDVSSSYVDQEWLLEERGELAVRMADPSPWTENPVKDGAYGAGQQRGNSNYNDFYIFSLITASYKLRTSRNGLPKF